MRTKTLFVSLFGIDLGIRTMAALLRQQGYESDIVSLRILRFKDELWGNNYLTPGPLQQKLYVKEDLEVFASLLGELRPDVLAFNVASTSLAAAVAMTRQARAVSSAYIIWGGIHPTSCPEECLSYADAVCLGEGEYPMLELVEMISRQEKVSGIRNLWIRHEDGTVERNSLRPLIDNLDALPYPVFARDGHSFFIEDGVLVKDPDIVSGHQKHTYPIMSSRGCHFHCSYCCNSYLRELYNGKGAYVRRRSPEHVIDELVQAKKTRTWLEVRFWDDIFTYDKDWISRFAQLYVRHVNLPFTCYAHPLHTDRTILTTLAKIGLRNVGVGVQSGSARSCQETLDRRQDNEAIKEFGKFLQGIDVTVRYHVIVDNVAEDGSDMRATVELLLQLPRPYMITVYSMCYFPQTVMTRRLLQEGLISPQDVEGRSHKALNNFYMFPQLARKDHEHYFWDLAVAAAASNFFADVFVRRCLDESFWRRWPVVFALYLKAALLFQVLGAMGRWVIFGRRSQPAWHQGNLLVWVMPGLSYMALKVYLRALYGRRLSRKYIFLTLSANQLERLTSDNRRQTLKSHDEMDFFLEHMDAADSQVRLSLRVDGPAMAGERELSLIILIAPMTHFSLERMGPCWTFFAGITMERPEVILQITGSRLWYEVNGMRHEAVRVGEPSGSLASGAHAVYVLQKDDRYHGYMLRAVTTLRWFSEASHGARA